MGGKSPEQGLEKKNPKVGSFYAFQPTFAFFFL
jgi:hypothetical protein